MELLAPAGLLVVMASLDLWAPWDAPARLAPVDRWDLPDLRVLRAARDPLVLLAPVEPPEGPALPAPLALLA